MNHDQLKDRLRDLIDPDTGEGLCYESVLEGLMDLAHEDAAKTTGAQSRDFRDLARELRKVMDFAADRTI